MTVPETAAPIAEPPTSQPPADLLAQHVGARVGQLQARYRRDDATAVATLARLRRALPVRGVLPPDAWDVLEDLPEPLLGRGDDPSRAELAAASALGLFALHQQSRRDTDMHHTGRDHPPGRAIGRLAAVTGAPGVTRRFRAMTRATDLDAVLQHLRGLVTQLRDHQVALDYGALARDLFLLQTPAGRTGVVMRWTRDFHRSGHPAQTPDLEASTTGEPS